MSTLIGRPGPVHEERVRTLEALATLAGFLTELPGLPDGRRPDVVRVCVRHRRLFLGEAKDSEGPGDQEALTRLMRYVAWSQEAGRHGSALLVVCCGRSSARRWASALTALAYEGGSPEAAYTEPLGRDDALAWLATSPTGQISARTQFEQRGL